MDEKFLHAEDQGAERSSRFQTRRDLNSSSAKSFEAFDPGKLTGKNTFGPTEKLKSKKIIEQVFSEGKSFSQNGFTLVYLPAMLPTFFPAQAGFSVPKSNFKRAVDRNRIKRLMREAYRLNKIVLYKHLKERKQQMALMFIYKGKEIPNYSDAEAAVVGCLSKLQKK